MLDVSDDIGPAGAPAEELLGSLTHSLLIEHQRIGIGPKRLPGLLERPRNRTSPAPTPRLAAAATSLTGYDGPLTASKRVPAGARSRARRYRSARSSTTVRIPL